jgi:hypothetical protein
LWAKRGDELFFLALTGIVMGVWVDVQSWTEELKRLVPTN